MTLYTVVWQKEALDDLAEIWLAASDRVAVTEAANSFDPQLKRDPDDQGEEVREGLRVLVISPLKAIYFVRPADCIVEVLRILRVI